MEELLHCLNLSISEVLGSPLNTLATPESLDLKIEVEFEKCGCRVVASSAIQMMTLDLSIGRKVKIISNHNHESLEKEEFRNKKRSSPEKRISPKSMIRRSKRLCEIKDVMSVRRPRLCDLVTGAGQPPPGGHRVGVVRGVSQEMRALVIVVDRAGGEQALLGLWWLEDMRAGLVENIPVVNISPRMSPRTGCGVCRREN